MQLPHASWIIAVSAIAVAAPALALAQSDDSAGRAAPPAARAGNIYDHKVHQPTESELPASARAGSSRRQVEEEVQQLLRQTDELDKQSNERARRAPSGSSGPR